MNAPRHLGSRRFSRLSLVVGAFIGSSVLILSLAALVGREGPTRTAELVRRKAALDSPQLWSVEVAPAQVGWPPVQLCTDAAMRAGFQRPDGVVGEQSCLPIEPARVDGNRLAFRCTLNGQMLGMSSTRVGDLQRDFTTRFEVTNLAGFLSGRTDATYAQTRRYRRLGACPFGWAVGDYTDRFGRRQHGALVVKAAPTRVRSLSPSSPG
jgi:hypothetical protein